MLAMLTRAVASGAPLRGAWYDIAVESRGQVVKAMVVIRRPRDGALLVSEEAAYEIGEQAILDTPDRTRVIWRAAGAVSPPLYPEGVADLAGARA